MGEKDTSLGLTLPTTSCVILCSLKVIYLHSDESDRYTGFSLKTSSFLALHFVFPKTFPASQKQPISIL